MESEVYRSTIARRRKKEGLRSVRIGARAYWVPVDLAEQIERMCRDAESPARGLEAIEDERC